MAQVSDDSGLPTVAADTRGIQVTQATPDAFGAQIAEGVGDIAQGLHKTSDFYGQVAADDAANNWHDKANKILYGDPNKTTIGPDGQPQQDTGYFGLRGANAMSQRPQVVMQLDQAAKEARSSLWTPQSQLQFDSETRRARFAMDEKIGSHYDQQYGTWAQSTNDTKAKIALNNLGADPLNPATKALSLQQTREAYVRNAQFKGEDPQGAILKADQDAALTQIRSLSISDPNKAQEVLDASKSSLASLPNYDAIVHSVEQSVINATMAPAIDSRIAKIKQDAETSTHIDPATPISDIHGAILGQESGNNPNAPTSVNGAIGPGQIKPEIFARFAKPGEKITNPADNRAVSARYVDYLSNLPNVQGDPARIAVGYFSGEGNIAPAGSATPYIHDYKDGNGKATSAYVSDVLGRTGVKGQPRYASVADYYAMNESKILDDARDEAARLFPQYPDAQERYVQGVGRHLQQTITQQHAQYEVDVNTVESAFASGHPPITEDQLNAMSPDMAAAWARMKINNPQQAATIENHFAAAAKGQARTYGTDFNTMLERVLAPTGDPNRISNPAQLWPYIKPGENAPLTNTGASELTNIMTRRQGAKGEAEATMLRSFLQNAHKMINPIQDLRLGIQYPPGEKKFQTFVAQAFPLIDAEQKAGKPLSETLGEKGQVYQSIIPFTMSKFNEMNERMNHAVYDPAKASLVTMDRTLKQVKTPDDLVALYKGGKITREQFDHEAVNRKWARQREAQAAPQVPLPQ